VKLRAHIKRDRKPRELDEKEKKKTRGRRKERGDQEKEKIKWVKEE